MSIKKVYLKTRPVCKVTFRLSMAEALGANSIYLVGEFNNWSETKSPMTPLKKGGFVLRRAATTTLQVNVGRICNQACRHCHLEAGPRREEIMSLETMDAVASYAARGGFESIDITALSPVHQFLRLIL